MDEHNTELYNANSEFYVLPTKEPKEPLNCKKVLYSLVTISSATGIGLLVGCFFAPWLFNTATLSTTGTTLVGAYYSQSSQFLLLLSCFAHAYMDAKSSTGNYLVSVLPTDSPPQMFSMLFKQYVLAS